jgi:hypothetical protein
VLQLPGNEERFEKEGVWKDVLRWLLATTQELLLQKEV